MSDYPAGTVAVATVDGVPNVRVFRYQGFGGELHWDSLEPVKNEIVHMDVELTDIRPLVVLDLEDEPLKTFIDAHSGGEGQGCGMGGADVVKVIEAQTKPSRIPQPGLYGVVKASLNGKATGETSWVRHHTGWYRAADDTAKCWSDLIDPTLIRDGIES